MTEKMVSHLALVLLLLLRSLPTYADSLSEAYRAFEKGQYDEAARNFELHTKKQPNDYDQLYNAGVAQFKKGAYDEAIRSFDQAKQTSDPLLKSRSAYNKGVALSQQQRWQDAEAAFQEALSYDNDNAMIRDNLEYVRQQKKQAPQNTAQNDAKSGQQKQPNQSQAEQQSSKKDAASNQDKQGQQDQQGQQDKQDQSTARSDAGAGQDQSGAQQKAQSSPQNAQPNQGQKDGKSEAKQDALAQGAENKTGEPKPSNASQENQRSATADGKKETAQQEAVRKEGEDATQSGTLAQESEQAGREGSQDQKGGQRVLTIKDMQKQEAEKLLRSVDDRIGSYILTPEQANTEGKSRNGKDW